MFSLCSLSLIAHSLEDSSLHGELEDIVALLEHLMLQSPRVHWQLTVLEDEALHDVAVVDVNGENLGQAHKHIVLHAVLGVDKRCQLL